MSLLAPSTPRKGDHWFDGTPLFPWAEDSAWPGGPSALLARLQVMSGICSSLCITVSLSQPCNIGSDLVNGLLMNRQREELIQLSLSRVFPSVSWGKLGYIYRNSACITKVALRRDRGQTAAVSLWASPVLCLLWTRTECNSLSPLLLWPHMFSGFVLPHPLPSPGFVYLFVCGGFVCFVCLCCCLFVFPIAFRLIFHRLKHHLAPFTCHHRVPALG